MTTACTPKSAFLWDATQFPDITLPGDCVDEEMASRVTFLWFLLMALNDLCVFCQNQDLGEDEPSNTQTSGSESCNHFISEAECLVSLLYKALSHEHCRCPRGMSLIAVQLMENSADWVQKDHAKEQKTTHEISFGVTNFKTHTHEFPLYWVKVRVAMTLYQQQPYNSKSVLLRTVKNKTSLATGSILITTVIGRNIVIIGVVFAQRLDSIILKVISNLNDSMIRNQTLGDAYMVSFSLKTSVLVFSRFTFIFSETVLLGNL
ncbi:hypothetical protein TURU_156204 [Turdus rufiventris]|nr:hypothetical protein TURU_156204 [Turdus rufiventris]